METLETEVAHVPSQEQQEALAQNPAALARENLDQIKKEIANGLDHEPDVTEVGDAAAEVLDTTVQSAEASDKLGEGGLQSIIQAAEIVEIASIDGGLDKGPVEDDPIATALSKGYEAPLIAGIQDLANHGELAVAEQVAADIEKREAEMQSTEYQAKIAELETCDKTTTEAFCLLETAGLPKSELKKIVDSPENWSPERRAVHEASYAVHKAESDALSERLSKHHTNPVILALRGSPGAGKTTALRMGHPSFEGILDDKGEATGAVAPDVFKPDLIGEDAITSSQVHAESTMLGRRLNSELINDPEASLVYDKLMNDRSDIDEMLKAAAETGKKAGILDIDVPLELSAIRVLGREKGGDSPNIAYDGVVAGFVGIRVNRGHLVNSLQAAGEDVVEGYALMAFDKASHQSVEVAIWQDGNIVATQGMEGRLAELTDYDALEANTEVARVKDMVLSEEYIEYVADTYFGSDESAQRAKQKTVANLRLYLGKTLAEALDEKAA